MSYNLVTLDNPTELPYPPEVKELVKHVDWEKMIWNSIGLPIQGAKYSITNKTLYQDELPTGQCQVKQINFTGEAFIGNFFRNPESEEDSFYIVFLLKFLNGILQESEVAEQQRWSTKEYDGYVNSIQKGVNAALNRRTKWWYKYLYTPYFYVVRYVTFFIQLIIKMIYEIVTKVCNWLTPI